MDLRQILEVPKQPYPLSYNFTMTTELTDIDDLTLLISDDHNAFRTSNIHSQNEHFRAPHDTKSIDGTRTVIPNSHAILSTTMPPGGAASPLSSDHHFSDSLNIYMALL